MIVLRVEDVLKAGVLITFVGIVLVTLAILLLAIKNASGKGEWGGVILIGPVPIVVGSSPKIALIVSILALVMMLIMLFLMWGAAKGFR
ncbi:TIGR00304 family membrane protein [Methanopyrus sp.]